MGLDLWFRQDVARILAAAWETMQSTKGALAMTDDRIACAYQRGFEDALRGVGVAFGLTTTGGAATEAGSLQRRPYAAGSCQNAPDSGRGSTGVDLG